MINIYEPYLNKEITKYAHDAIDSTWISSHGKYLNLVKDELTNIMNNNYVILTSNGTTATHLLAIGLKYKYTKIKNIIVPNNVYVAAWNSFLMKPIFNLIPIDSDLLTWNINLEQLDEKIKQYSSEDTAVLIVHNVGNIINVPELKRKYKDYIFIEDNCEGFLGEYENMKSGTQSFISSVSFFGNKTLTCGEGGAIFLDDEKTFDFLNSTKSQGITNTKFIFDKLGYNYRMTNIEAALLYGQLKHKDEIINKKSEIFNKYKKMLNGYVDFQYIDNDTKHANWMFGIKFKDVDINKISLNLYQQDIETRPMFPPMSCHKHLDNYSNSDNEKNSKILYESCLLLPSHPNLNLKDVEYVSQQIKKQIKK